MTTTALPMPHRAIPATATVTRGCRATPPTPRAGTHRPGGVRPVPERLPLHHRSLPAAVRALLHGRAAGPGTQDAAAARSSRRWRPGGGWAAASSPSSAASRRCTRTTPTPSASPAASATSTSSPRPTHRPRRCGSSGSSRRRTSPTSRSAWTAAAQHHDAIRGTGTFDAALSTIAELTRRGFDTRIICTVNQANRGTRCGLLDIADDLAVSLVKFHVFSTIGTGGHNPTGHDPTGVGGLLRPPARGRAQLPDARLVPADVRPARPDGALRRRGLPGMHRPDPGPHLDLPRRPLLRLLLPLRHHLYFAQMTATGSAQPRGERVRPVHQAARASSCGGCKAWPA